MGSTYKSERDNREGLEHYLARTSAETVNGLRFPHRSSRFHTTASGIILADPEVSAARARRSNFGRVHCGFWDSKGAKPLEESMYAITHLDEQGRGNLIVGTVISAEERRIRPARKMGNRAVFAANELTGIFPTALEGWAVYAVKYTELTRMPGHFTVDDVVAVKGHTYTPENAVERKANAMLGYLGKQARIRRTDSLGEKTEVLLGERGFTFMDDEQGNYHVFEGVEIKGKRGEQAGTIPVVIYQERPGKEDRMCLASFVTLKGNNKKTRDSKKRARRRKFDKTFKALKDRFPDIIKDVRVTCTIHVTREEGVKVTEIVNHSPDKN